MPTLFLTKAPKIYDGEKTASSTNVAGKLVTYLQKLKVAPCLSHCTRIKSKWTKGLNIRPETLKLVQEKGGNTLEAIGTGKDFLSRSQAAQQIREWIAKWDYMILKSFCTTEDIVSKLKRPCTE
jgi:hypothetical protein